MNTPGYSTIEFRHSSIKRRRRGASIWPGSFRPQLQVNADNPSAYDMRPARQFTLFVIVGALATGTHVLCLALLVELGAWPALPASCVGALAGALVSYWLNYHHTFSSAVPHRLALPRFLAVAAVAFVLNAALMAVALRTFGLQYLLAQILTTATVLIFTFSAGRLWAFR